jgi:hypothetical protein
VVILTSLAEIRVHGRVWVAYFIVKVLYLFFAKIVVSKFIRLGDTFRYLNGPSAWQGNWYYNSTSMMDSFASVSAKVFGTYMGSFPFLVLSFFGVYYPISKIKPTKKQLWILLSFLSLPSFGIWTSVASKESVSVFFMGVILAAYIDVYECKSVQKKALFFLSLYLCLVFKPHYMIALFAIFSFTLLSRKLVLTAHAKVLLFIAAVCFGVFALYYFRDIIDMLSKMIPAHFSQGAGSTRENTIWVEQYDFFKNAAYGMYIAFVGPTVHEALSSPVHMLAWIESMIILGAFGILTLKYGLTAALRSKVNVMFICGFSLVTFWILLVHYPFGALNPGSAIRYRESFYAFLVTLFFFMYRNAMTSFPIRRQYQIVKNFHHDGNGFGRSKSVS